MKFKFTVLVFTLLLFNCSRDPSEIPDENNVPPLVFFINAEVNGANIETKSQPSNLQNYNSTMGYNTKTDMSNNCINRSYSPKLSRISDNSLPEFQIGFINLLDEATMTCDNEAQYFETFLEQQMYTYAENALGTGVSIKYNASSNAATYTSYSTQPANAEFEITAIEIVDCSPKKCINVSGIFTATLFNLNDVNDTISITNGAFKLRVQSQN